MLSRPSSLLTYPASLHARKQLPIQVVTRLSVH